MFKRGLFTLHSGEESEFLIDCNTLTDDDLVALAAYVGPKLPPFGLVEGVPHGGLGFAEALRYWSTYGGRLLIVDDVCTTGSSMEEQRDGREAHGVVIFARTDSWPAWVRPIFVMPP